MPKPPDMFSQFGNDDLLHRITTTCEPLMADEEQRRGYSVTADWPSLVDAAQF